MTKHNSSNIHKVQIIEAKRSKRQKCLVIREFNSLLVTLRTDRSINACFCNLSCRNPNDIFADLESYPDFSEIAN